MRRSRCGWVAVLALVVALPLIAQESPPTDARAPAAASDSAAPSAPVAPLVTDLASPSSGASPYLPEQLACGELKLSGSRTMSAVAAVWSDGFKHLHPASAAKLDFQGSETAFAQLAGDAPAIGLLSRDLTAAEQEAFTKAHPDRRLVAITAAYDALAVIVHPENPIEGLTLPQLKTLFAQPAGANANPAPLTWASVGLTEDWANTPVVRFAPDEQSGARAQFVERVLGPGAKPAPATPYSWHTKIVEEVAAQRGAIGFVNAAAARSRKVRTVPIAAEAPGEFVPLSPETIAAETYPLRRPLSLLVVLKNDAIASPLTAEFVRYVLSQNGQDDVVKDGFQPLGRSELLEQFDKLDWNQAK
ncbi:MAG TPA: PstS family phosphate ABC transporter substrate-binding protein [Pirellulales bacterium]